MIVQEQVLGLDGIERQTSCNESLILLPSSGVCRNLGWHCPQLHDPFMILYLLFIFIRWAFSAFIIVSSQTIVGHDIIKYFTLNLLAICIPCDLFLAARQCITVAQLYCTVFYSSQTLLLFNAFLQLLSDAVAFQYRAMSLFVVFTMYMLFVFPLRMQQFLSGRTYKYYFISMHMLTPFACAPRFLVYFVKSPTVLAILRRYSSIVPYSAFFIISIFLFFITILAIFALVRHHTTNVEGATKRERKNLISFLIYCVPLNLMNIPTCASAIALLLHHILPQHMVSVLLHIRFSCAGEQFIIQARTIIIAICTIVALAPYRRAFTRLAHRKRDTQTKQFMPASTTSKRMSSDRRPTLPATRRRVFGANTSLVATTNQIPLHRRSFAQ
ncbi:hypothetical protein Tcan_02919 [Toxocara canis]|uniref:G_PROTEIN_RECEP_F1_2 domain-containing protein n=1 Tax=Toxocara canis TaxID=6265 RepID=A0A0B2V2M0_TOXCA|nr:hypothetical protein Tcan_02919 [Toxocara canis]